MTSKSFRSPIAAVSRWLYHVLDVLVTQNVFTLLLSRPKKPQETRFVSKSSGFFSTSGLNPICRRGDPPLTLVFRDLVSREQFLHEYKIYIYYIYYILYIIYIFTPPLTMQSSPPGMTAHIFRFGTSWVRSPTEEHECRSESCVKAAAMMDMMLF